MIISYLFGAGNGNQTFGFYLLYISMLQRCFVFQVTNK